MQLVMNVLRWIVLSHCVYRVSNYCLSVYLDIAGLQQSRGQCTIPTSTVPTRAIPTSGDILITKTKLLASSLVDL